MYFFFFFFCISILITKKNTYETIAASNCSFGSLRDTKRQESVRLDGLGTSLKNVSYGKRTRTTTPKILSFWPLNIKKHTYKQKQKSARQFFIIKAGKSQKSNTKKSSLQILTIFVV